MSEQKFPPRCYLDPAEFTMECEDFAAVAQLKLTGIADVQYLSLTEHQHLVAEKDKRIERLREALNNLMGYWDDPCRFDHNQNCQEHYSFNYDGTCSVADARAALQEDGK